MANRYSDEEEDVFQPVKREGEEDFISVDYLDRPKEKKHKEGHKAEAKPEFKEEKKEAKAEPKKEAPGWEPAKSNTGSSFGKEEDSSLNKAGTWQFLSLLLAIIIVVSVFTQGFGSLTGKTVADSLSPAEAEQKAISYINANLLQPPFTATAVKTEESGSLYKIKIDVAGRQIDSYVTKDGKLFFPQGLELNAALPGAGRNTPPEAEEIKPAVDISGEPVKGKADAPVTIIEFSDFQCPLCQKAWEVMKQVEADYVAKNKVKLVFKNFPLDSLHPLAQAAAQASECAQEQGKFWEYHDKIFANQQGLSNDNLKKWAKETGLDESRFNSCLDSRKYKNEVAQDQQEGLKAGVQGTPAFLINGQLYSGALPYAQLKQLIEAELAKLAADNGNAAPAENTAKSAESAVKEVEATAQETVKAIETKPVQTKELKINLKKFVFTPAELTVSKGDTVKMIVANTADIKLGYEVSAFNAGKEVEAGQTGELSFTADKAGTYDITCNAACGSKKGAILGALVVK